MHERLLVKMFLDYARGELRLNLQNRGKLVNTPLFYPSMSRTDISPSNTETKTARPGAIPAEPVFFAG